LLIAAYSKGCRFDGWSDRFNYDLWQEAIAAEEIEPDFFTSRPRDVAEPLPWDHIDSQVNQSFLAQELANALEHNLTQDCRNGSCQQCGTCDFEKIEPRTHRSFEKQSDLTCQAPGAANIDFKSLCVFYSKKGQAKYFGHLEMVNVFLRAVKRAGIQLKYSEGFHPKPKISFDDPLPIGIESDRERLIMKVPGTIEPDTVTHALNSQLPEGLVIISSQFLAPTVRPEPPCSNTYQVTLRDGHFNQDDLRSFNGRSEVTISLSNRKGKLKKINLKDMVKNIEWLDSRQLRVSLSTETGKTLRPAHILGPVFHIREDQIRLARVVKLKKAESKEQSA
jgi:radical SAM-linked protein